MHEDLRSRTLEGAGHADVVRMQVRDEDTSHLVEPDPGIGERATQNLFGVSCVQSRVDERVPRRSLDQIGVHAPEGERKGQLDAPDARRDDRSAQREQSFARLITVEWLSPGPFV